ncbi:putative N-acetyltransferase YvbK [Yarrowia sp. C11]|nr:putative N-acetyltransferase YvbK [Yarrowia sp. C11]KAG5364404.1 putative N-acetyltransferase YvbK [Yarrowia sp. E02]
MNLKEVPKEHRQHLLPLLLIADESEEIVQTYIDDGNMYEIVSEDGPVGVVQVIGDEIKNLAISPKKQGQGLGKKAIALLQAQPHVSRLLVGTANSSIDNLAFYQKCGFRFSDIRKDFFLQYPEPIFENGIRALDMVMLEWRE